MGRLFVALVSALYFSSAFSQATVELESDQGDYIGQGKSYLYDESNSVISFSRNYDNGITVNIDQKPGDDSSYFWWTFNLAAPEGLELKPGVYESAQRHPFQDIDKPGLDFSGTGRGCNSLTGFFEIRNVEYNDEGDVEELDVYFEQHCEGNAAALKGSIAFNTETTIGVRALGLAPKKVVCTNRSTGITIKRKVEGPIHDCKKLGLEVNEGDKVVVKIIGFAEK